MAKARESKRQLVRNEKRARKRKHKNENDEELAKEPKRPRGELQAGDDHTPQVYNDDEEQYGGHDAFLDSRGPHLFEREFFGMLAEEEQEYFRHADELLELNNFPTPADRAIFLRNVYHEAKGKELKLASSQGCSRLMERLILLSNTQQKKRLFGVFAGHFPTLVTHRFASHCCEKLFLQAAPVVSREMGGVGLVVVEDDEDEEEGGVEEKKKEALRLMEDLFLETLDELEEHLSYLVSDKFGSHTLRVLLLVLSGRPLNEVSTRSLVRSKKKENVTVQGDMGTAIDSGTRAVPFRFKQAIIKIIADATHGMDPTAFRVLARHQTANPVFQLFLDLEISTKKGIKGAAHEKTEECSEGLLEKLVPGAPQSLSVPGSPAHEFVSVMLYEPIGSRLLETLITLCPGKIFKELWAQLFAPHLESILRNDIAMYPAMKALSRLSKQDLERAVGNCIDQVPLFVEKSRFAVLRLLFERCHVRDASSSIHALLNALVAAYGGDANTLVPKLCMTGMEFNPDAEAGTKNPKNNQEGVQPDILTGNHTFNHGCQLVGVLLKIPGDPARAIQGGILALPPDQLFKMATISSRTATILADAFSVPAAIPHFHKRLAALLAPKTMKLARWKHGLHILKAIVAAPSVESKQAVAGNEAAKRVTGGGLAAQTAVVVPFHVKDMMMRQLGENEEELRVDWRGRQVWHAWKGDVWKTRPRDWTWWAKNGGGPGTSGKL